MTCHCIKEKSFVHKTQQTQNSKTQCCICQGSRSKRKKSRGRIGTRYVTHQHDPFQKGGSFAKSIVFIYFFYCAALFLRCFNAIKSAVPSVSVKLQLVLHQTHVKRTLKRLTISFACSQNFVLLVTEKTLKKQPPNTNLELLHLFGIKMLSNNTGKHFLYRSLRRYRGKY